jgi:hypothetical protein
MQGGTSIFRKETQLLIKEIRKEEAAIEWQKDKTPSCGVNPFLHVSLSTLSLQL